MVSKKVARGLQKAGWNAQGVQDGILCDRTSLELSPVGRMNSYAVGLRRGDHDEECRWFSGASDLGFFFMAYRGPGGVQAA